MFHQYKFELKLLSMNDNEEIRENFVADMGWFNFEKPFLFDGFMQ